MIKRERYISIIIAPHHKSKPWQKDLSYSTLKQLAVAGGVVALFLLLLVLNYGRILWRASQYELIKTRYAEIERDFAELQNLRNELARLKKTEQKLKVMMGLPKQPEMLSIAQINRTQEFLSSTQVTVPSPADSGSDSAKTEHSSPSIMPVKGWISANMTDTHKGVDIAAREGDPVLAAADGVVTFAGWDNYFGNKVVITHGAKFTTMYGHNAKILVKEGQSVKQGQVICLVGSTGRSSGPHLHYEVFANGKNVDPSFYWINH